MKMDERKTFRWIGRVGIFVNLVLFGSMCWHRHLCCAAWVLFATYWMWRSFAMLDENIALRKIANDSIELMCAMREMMKRMVGRIENDKEGGNAHGEDDAQGQPN